VELSFLVSYIFLPFRLAYVSCDIGELHEHTPRVKARGSAYDSTVNKKKKK